jgi:hypothetical protein
MTLEPDAVDELLGDEVADYPEQGIGFSVDGLGVEVVLMRRDSLDQTEGIESRTH